MRSKNKPASLNELVGEDKEFSLSNLKQILGEKTPDLPLNRIGKYRLINALKIRFGPGYRNIPGVSNIIHEFEEKIETENVIRLNKRGK